MRLTTTWIAIGGLTLLQLAGGPVSASPPDDPIDAIVERLKVTDIKTLDAAAKELEGLSERGLTPEQASQCLRAAAQPFPPRLGKFHDGCSDLLEAATTRACADMVPIVEAAFAFYSEPGRTQALALLLGVDDETAARAVVRILNAFTKDGGVPSFPEWAFTRHPHHLDVLFPALLDFVADPRLTHDICYVCWKLVSEGKLPASAPIAKADRLIAANQTSRKALAASWHEEGLSWRGGEEYGPIRETAGLLLDLLGYVDTPESRAELRASLDIGDPYPRCYAVLSLLRLGEEVGKVPIRSVAACDEMRGMFCSELQKLSRSALFPQEFQTQEAFARSDMVRWLTYPTELGAPPDEIELMKVVSIETGDSRTEFYLFRFRVHAPHWAAKDGWEAGWSGGYDPLGQPDASSPGQTFSCFHPWDPDVAEADIRKMLKRRDGRSKGK